MKTLMAIGGAINANRPEVLQEFVNRAGRDAAQIVILPQASALPETGENYKNGLQSLGAGSVKILEFLNRAEDGKPEQLQMLREATGIFITGGAQMRLSSLFGGTILEKELQDA